MVSISAAKMSGGMSSGLGMSLLVEMEGVCLPVRAALFDLLREIFASRQIDLSRSAFLRASGPLAALTEQVAEAVKADVDVSEIRRILFEGLGARLNSGQIAADRQVLALVEEAKKRGLTLAAVTGLPDAVAQAAYSASRLAHLDVPLYSFGDEEKPFPRADAWLKAAKQLGRSARACIAVVSSQLSCKTALSAGMRTVAIPDEFTAYQDFSGCDAVIESWDDYSPTALIDQLTAVPL